MPHRSSSFINVRCGKFFGICFVLVNGGYAVYLNVFTLMLSWSQTSPTLNQCGLDGTDSHLVAPIWVPMNHFGLIRVNKLCFLELLERVLFLLAGPPMDSNRLSGKTLAQFSWRLTCLFHSETLPFAPGKNEVSMILRPQRKLYS